MRYIRIDTLKNPISRLSDDVSADLLHPIKWNVKQCQNKYRKSTFNLRLTSTVDVHFGEANRVCLSSTVDAAVSQKSHLQHTEAKAEATRRPFLSCAACEEREQRHPARRCWPAAGPAPLVLLTRFQISR